MTKTCKRCGKTDYDDPTGCKKFILISAGVGNWVCTVDLYKKKKGRNSAVNKRENNE